MKYAGNITILDDQGNMVYERELSADEMIAELLPKAPVELTEEMRLGAAVVDTVLRGPLFKKKGKKVRGGGDSKKRKGGEPCGECGSKGRRHKNGCALIGSTKTEAAKKVDADDDAWNSFRPRFTQREYGDIRGLAIDGKNSVQIVSELDLVADDMQQVNFCMAAKSYGEYFVTARKEAFR